MTGPQENLLRNLCRSVNPRTESDDAATFRELVPKLLAEIDEVRRTALLAGAETKEAQETLRSERAITARFRKALEAIVDGAEKAPHIADRALRGTK